LPIKRRGGRERRPLLNETSHQIAATGPPTTHYCTGRLHGRRLRHLRRRRQQVRTRG